MTTRNNELVFYVPQLISDGSFEINFESEELSGAKLYCKVMPVSQTDIDKYKCNRDLSFINYSDDSAQAIVTLAYPDPQNPLSSSTMDINLYFLRTNVQDRFMKAFLYGKIWKIGDNILEIGNDGEMNLNNGSSTGSIYISSYADNEISPYIPAKVEMWWDKGDIVYYDPVLLTTDMIELQNRDNSEEKMTLEYVEDIETAEPGTNH